MNRILITGASGFVGRHVVRRLVADGQKLNLAGRTNEKWSTEGDVRFCGVGGVGQHTDWTDALRDCDRVLHLAAQVPLPGVTDEAFQEVNNKGTERLVEQACENGVEFFILLSSVFAVSDHSADGPISEDTPTEPLTAYGRSKLDAEHHLNSFAQPGRTAIVLRPSVVYGAAAQGNWRLLQRLAATGLPLPFASVDNRRTLTAVDNLADAIVHLLTMPREDRRSGIFMIGDGEAASLKDIILWLRTGMGLPARLLPAPKKALSLLLKVIGRAKVAQSMLGDLEVDSTRFRQTFAWTPKIRTEEGIKRSGKEFMGPRKS
ncbi:NAD-dependent epimerase/dehydratase family protein [Aurantimonas sp. A3-2-R12]|uniref:NAD-dependent epimerase/dehydratase family protein n=1 Tax=Aurantimonas sp. A3-2-R12 TaxID=3114362 RepID=UPI002E18F355|nr:NAD-dependent epimerase/dehydratase family protein [Aurantimonas sp. A3-2-R12]